MSKAGQHTDILEADARSIRVPRPRHVGSKGISIRQIPGLGKMPRTDARATEQVLIELHGLSRNGGTLMNRINSIAQTNPAYAGALRRGTQILRGIGYPGI